MAFYPYHWQSFSFLRNVLLSLPSAKHYPTENTFIAFNQNKNIVDDNKIIKIPSSVYRSTFFLKSILEFTVTLFAWPGSSKQQQLKENWYTRTCMPGYWQWMKIKQHITLATTYLLCRFQGRKLSSKQIYSGHKLFDIRVVDHGVVTVVGIIWFIEDFCFLLIRYKPT